MAKGEEGTHTAWRHRSFLDLAKLSLIILMDGRIACSVFRVGR